ncbi:unnamed protein product (macronuclear) [Paramecium tetraurelia]|uniref:NB-ARC domain-containing protein n=1 Tax=Paramecium tetraurelia TaxID=5888 RepID=A0DLL8_PARTE|nr:uncharacterized protein GSPATT00018253001 [Paramecium tetraurelia]CAK83935.1 unnamed protein product [Paramecium tetraurelia]|eukprot:XP_001451332.1 hypothetical protein (macronuclear) [Paramecium tetraurelia strain d4-2]
MTNQIQREMKLEKEKYENFLPQLKKIEDFRKFIQIQNWDQLIRKTETVIQTLEKFGCPDKEIIKMLINEELTQLKTIISKINYEVQESSKDQVRRVVIQDDKQVGKSENGVFANQIRKKFNFSSNESQRTYLSSIMKVIKLKKLILTEEFVLLHKLLEEVVFFSDTFRQIQEYEKEIQIKFSFRFQCRISEFIQKFEKRMKIFICIWQKPSYLKVQMKQKLMFQIFLIAQNFIYIKKLDQKDFLIQQIKKIYLEKESEKVDSGDEQTEQFGLLDNMVQRFKDFTNNEQWKIKQGLVFTIIQISSNQFSDSMTSFCQKVIIQLWVQEKDQRVRNILKNQGLVSMQMQILQKDWQTQQDRIEGKMQEMLRRIDELQEQIFHEANLSQRDHYLKELDETTEQLDQQIQNISEMGQQLRLITDFVNHIRKGLIRVEGKINEMKEQLKSIGNDVKFLRGKSKMESIEKKPHQGMQNPFMYHYKLRRYLIKVKKKEDKLKQIDDANGEVNEFLLEENETVLLIHGVAGSGKSTTAKKIEEFVWKLHTNNKKIRNQILIPVYISLPSLKNPVFQAVEETLHQDEYGFDELQLRECKEILEKKEFRLLLIMDSYDEMKLENIQKNLYMNNKVKQNWSDPLVIFTTRSEIFTSSNYTFWFAPDNKENLKEIQLQKFNPKQIMEYLKKFTIQSVKMQTFDIYEWRIGYQQF